MDCPVCGEAMWCWGWYRRDLRVGVVWRLFIRRQRCAPCAASHAVLADFVTHGRLDGVEVIGEALEALGHAEAPGVRPVAERADVAHTTVRDWWRRFKARAPMLAVGFAAYCVATGALAPRCLGEAEAVALGAIRACWEAARRRFGPTVGRLWRFANAVVGAQLCSTNMNPPWSGL